MADIEIQEIEIKGGTGGSSDAARDKAAPAVPMPPHAIEWQEGDYTVIRGTARTPPGCHNDCGVLMYVKDGKLEKVEGDPDCPYNKGRLCTRCLALPDYVYHSERILHPMKRAKEDRGKDKWEQCSWDEAYAIIEKEMGEIAEKYGPESVVFGQGTGRDILYLFRLAYSYGSPNEGNPWFTGQACYLPRVASMALMLGAPTVADCAQFLPQGYDDERYTVPECMIIWGCNPVWCNSDGFFGHWVTDLMKLGMKTIVIDPQCSWLAAHADMWLRVRPGSDGALAMGMLRVIMEEKLYDAEFCDYWVYGLEALEERCMEYDLDKVSELTWVPKEQIIEAARMYAAAKPATIHWGVAIDHTTGGVEAAHAITCLWTITGNLDVPGGNVMGPPCWGIEQANWTGGWGYDELLTDQQKAARFGVEQYPMFRTGYLNPQPDVATQALMTGEPYEIHGLWLQTSNFSVGMGAQAQTYIDYYRKLDFIVDADLFMTPIAMELADVFLPVATYPERLGFGGMQPYFIGAINPAIDRVGECKSDMQIIWEVGRMFNPDAWPWETEEQIMDSLLAQGGFTWQELREATWKYPQFEYRKYEKGLLRSDGKVGFNTPTGRAELFSTAYNAMGYNPLPSYVESSQTPLSMPEEAEKFPYILTSGARIPFFFHSEHRQISKLRTLHPDPLIYMHPNTGAAKGVKEGDWVWIENMYGKTQYKVSFNESYDERVLQAEHGWWFPEEGPEDKGFGPYGEWKSNVNMLISLGCGPTGFGGGYKTMICDFYKVEE